MLGAMIYYIDAFPERFHHPKEDEYLFYFLRIRHPDAIPLVDRLQERTSGRRGKDPDARAGVGALPAGRRAGVSSSSWRRSRKYAQFHWQHMKAEEDEVLPLARKHLAADDWDAIDAAFSGHTDPMLGIDVGAGFTALFNRIATCWLRRRSALARSSDESDSRTPCRVRRRFAPVAGDPRRFGAALIASCSYHRLGYQFSEVAGRNRRRLACRRVCLTDHDRAIRAGGGDHGGESRQRLFHAGHVDAAADLLVQPHPAAAGAAAHRLFACGARTRAAYRGSAPPARTRGASYSPL